MTTIDRLLAHAGEYAAGIVPQKMSPAPEAGVTVVACMDARMDLFRILGLSVGDAHILRNAGGTVTEDTIRSLAISQRKLRTREIILVHHTDCGMLSFTDEEFAAEIERETGIRPAWRAAAFTDLADDLRRSVRLIRDSPAIPHRDLIAACIYDVATGGLTRIEA
jgi:carbonic anhydrase